MDDLLEKRKSELRRRYAKALRDGDVDEQDIDKFAKEDIQSGKITATPEANAPIAPTATPAAVSAAPTPAPAPIPSAGAPSETSPPAAAEAPEEPKGPALAPAPKKVKTDRAGDLAKMQEIIDKEGRLSDEEKSVFTDKISALKQAEQEIKNRYNTRQESAEFAESMEIIGQAMAKLAAGYYGMKHGVDMSGVKFNARDWSKDYDRILKKYEIDSTAAAKQTSGATEEMQHAEKMKLDLAKKKSENFQAGQEAGYKDEEQFAGRKEGVDKFNAGEINKFNRDGDKEKSDKSSKAREKSLTKIEEARSLLEQLKEAESDKQRDAIKSKLGKAVAGAGKDGKSILAALTEGEKKADPVGPNWKWLQGDIPEATADAEALLDKMKEEIESGNAAVRKANEGGGKATFKDKATGETRTLTDPKEIAAAKQDPELEEVK